MPMILMGDVPLAGKRVLIREDLNVPIADGRVANAARIDAAVPTIAECTRQGASVMVMSHLGRPTEGVVDPTFSLAPVAAALGERLGQEVRLVPGGRYDAEIAPGEVVVLENVRFEPGEKANDDALAKRMAASCDVYVMDAFATAHRAQASTHGVAKHAPIACAGPLLAREIDALHRALESPARPLVAIVGGAKVSTKLAVLESLAGVADRMLAGGGIANTFLLAAGRAVGASLVEEDQANVARRIVGRVDVPLPSDVMTATRVGPDVAAVLRGADEVADSEMILDVGPVTARSFRDLLSEAGTILWNGPLGVFEYDQFGEGTRLVAEAVAASDAFSVAGGGDTIAAIDKYGVRDGISYISTGGGAFLEFVEGRALPAV
ncbi:MAG: phosphoglycerate kinase, partial [Gammaproteobacteria bacterium]|nr:phosphoglycerate kinase [Gammaproteobacteria bacterium]